MTSSAPGPDRLHLAYVVYWGATEPLGRTVAVPAVEALSRHVDVTLISFEKPEDRANPERMEAVRERLARAGARWHPLTYRSSPPVVSSFLDVWSGTRLLERLHRERPFDIVEGRTFVGGLVGSFTANRLRRPFVYYQDACWPEEQVDAGTWGRGSLPDLVARRLEAVSFRSADGVVVLTGRTLERLRRDGSVPPGLPSVVAPTTSGVIDDADPDELRTPGSDPDGPLRLLYLGSVSGRYPLDAILDFASTVRSRRPGSTLSVYAHRDRDLVQREAATRGLEEVVRVDQAEPRELPEVFRTHDAGLALLRPGLSSRCQTPTKVGEYLAFGLPVISNEAVGDVPALLREHRVGVVLPELARDAYAGAVDELSTLAADPTLPRRAHRVATTVFDGEAAARRQVGLFRDLLS